MNPILNSFFKLEKPAEMVHTHTKTLSDGRVLDIIKLWQESQNMKPKKISLDVLDAPKKKNKKTGFSEKRYDKADVSYPLLVDEKNFLLDGRHRYFKLKDNNHDVAMVKKVTNHMIDKCIQKKAMDLSGVIGTGFKAIEKGLPSIKNNPTELKKYENMTSPEMWNMIAGPNVLTHEMNKKASIVKEAMQTKVKQIPTSDQVTRHPSAVIIQGDQDYIRGNHHAQRFYADIAAFIRQKGYTVSTVKGEGSGQPPGANVWVSHGGHNPPKGTKVLNIPQYPRPFMTKDLISALDRVTTQKK